MTGSGVLHGLRVVAALKHNNQVAFSTTNGVLHGLRVVAALKQCGECPASPAQPQFSTAFGSWPH